MNCQLQEETDPPIAPRGNSRQPHGDPLKNLTSHVSFKLEEGDFKGALRVACSEDSMADINAVETLSALKEKHPPMHLNSQFPPLVEGTASTQISISEEDVCHAIQSFPRGSAGGPDGIRPQHLSDLTSASAERGSRELLSPLTSFCNLVVSGLTPQFAQPIFFGATLIPLRKKDGGVHTIAVGQTFRRLVANCVSIHVIHNVRPDLAPLQLSCGVPLGCEAAALAAHHYLYCIPLNNLLLKLDFKKAFNTLRCDKMIDVVQQSTPEMFSFISSAYASPSHLFCGDNILQSAEGVQQGDPLGPLLFCITTQQLILNLRSEFSVFYLHDGTL